MHAITLSTLTATVVVAAAGRAASAQFVSFNDRAAFLAALDTTLIDDDLEQFAGADVDFENSSANASSPGPLLGGFDVSHSGDEVTTQFVNGSLTNSVNTGNPGVDIQFILDLAGTTGAFGGFSNQADTGTITVQTAGVNAMGFDAFGFNDQGLSFLADPQALGTEMGVLTTVQDTLGNTSSFTINASDPFFGVVGLAAPIDFITFEAVTTFANSGVEFISIDNIVGGVSTIPAPASLALLGLGGLTIARRRRA
ncbi:MAG: PEP-CTERM sorting domain-containing protein [Planctomycetota bacterium]